MNKIKLTGIILLFALFVTSSFFCFDYRAKLQQANEEITAFEAICPARDFTSTAELEAWLAANKANEHPYSPDYDCDDFALALWGAAQSDGYRIGIVTFSSPNPLLDLLLEDYHTMNFAIIGNNVYYIEPQNDWFNFSGVTQD